MKRAAGPFEILEILGEGSFGTVCVARVSTDPLRRKVALKILKGAYATNKKILNRTRDEARLLSRINHRNIVRVERLMEVGGRPVVVMEHVQGVSLDALLLRFKDGLPAAVALSIIEDTCWALHTAYAEALGDDMRPLRVIHRDIKPSNIMLSVDGLVKVLDFGIAKGEFEGREAETESVVMGSRPYMAPERLDGISDSPSVDVYSTGMSLFELLTGRTMSLSINPVNHDQAMNRQLAYIQVPGMSEASVEDLRNLIRRMCAYTRDYRPSAIECRRDLEQLRFAIDPQYNITLEEFARTTVVPIYESRPRIDPESAMAGDGDDAFLREVTGAITNPGTLPTSKPTQQSLAAYTPYIFVGVLGFVVVLLCGGVVLRLMLDRSGTTGLNPVEGKALVSVWLPSDADAQVGDTLIRSPGRYELDTGTQLMQMFFQDGRALNCTFQATEGAAVRFVVDAGKAGLSVNDGAVQPCVEVTSKATP
ncbi:MAG: serine/threonine protein kinase [Myxococcales bacterium]|nr:serine/threonine protein kinase [Myxococcales bacterium]MCB9671043.1 serine/threonine protein kinase [Alphaproteobacteria bacterium]MCB9692298.1 serine/threonine protein kinase [Alphaproteobacteria bacterium]